MCQLKEGKDLATDSDLQNLVTGTILRQTMPFTFEIVMSRLVKSIEESQFQDQIDKVRKVCLRTLEGMLMSDCIRPDRKVQQYQLSRRII